MIAEGKMSDKHTPRRSTLDGQELSATYFDDLGQPYTVPMYSTRPGQSVDEVARLLGGRCAGRRERARAIAQVDGLWRVVAKVEGR